MKVLISEIPEEGIEAVLKEKVEAETIISPISARLKISKVDSEVMVKGEVVADVKLRCSRCLMDFSHKLDIPVDVVYHPLDELKGEERHEVIGEELDIDFYSEEEMNLITLMKEQIILNIPMKPLCSDLCRGICFKCGKNLNAGDCSCTENETGSRFVVLKNLFDKDT